MTGLVNRDALWRNGTWVSPFPHLVVDGFLKDPDAIEREFLRFDSEDWFQYKSDFQVKKTCNNWFLFPPATYQMFHRLMGADILGDLCDLFNCNLLYPDFGLHGGGWHCHGNGGVLHPHLDYSIHPRLGKERKLNIILYLEPKMREEHGGHLGLWEGDAHMPGKLVKEIAPFYNRAVIFDTTQNSWHGMSRSLSMPPGVYRRSIAIYYLCDPSPTAPARDRATFRSPA